MVVCGPLGLGLLLPLLHLMYEDDEDKCLAVVVDAVPLGIPWVPYQAQNQPAGGGQRLH